MEIPLIIIAGPTGVGKTKVAIEIAERLDGEIVGADSRQIYRYMNIGTAKPRPAERARVPHHLIDICDPDEDYSAVDFARDASSAIRDIHERGKIPLLVGGTGLYIQAVLYGIFKGPGRDETLRAELRRLAEKQGNMAVYQELQRVDPETAARLHPNDLVRIIRALEVFRLTGRSISTHQTTATTPIARYAFRLLVLTTERKWLYARINGRVEDMIAAGLVDEVRDLFMRGYHAELNAMQSLGYKEIGEFLGEKLDLSTAVKLIKRNTRRYAKRQLTWFRKYETGIWVAHNPSESMHAMVDKCVRLLSRA